MLLGRVSLYDIVLTLTLLWLAESRLPGVAHAQAATRDGGVLVLLDPDAPGVASLRRGLTFGADEARHTSAMFDVDFSIALEECDTATCATAAVRRAHQGTRRPHAIVTMLPEAWLNEVLAETADSGIPILSVAARVADDGVGAVSSPRPRLFRIWPDAGSGAALAADAPRVELWHHTLVRFGAAQLNQRFTHRHQVPMDSHAWAGWFAVKALGEVLLRNLSSDAPALAVAIARSTFDGHKGRPLRFDAASGLLTQPLYCVGRAEATDAEQVLEDAPCPSEPARP